MGRGILSSAATPGGQAHTSLEAVALHHKLLQLLPMRSTWGRGWGAGKASGEFCPPPP